MLVLSRQRDETVMIGDDIEITIVDVRGEKVRLGIRAPKDVAVHRKEVYDAIRRENQSAAKLHPTDLAGAPAKPAPAPRPPLRLVKDGEPDPLLHAALEEAQISLAEGGLPIGAVLVRDGKIIARGHDRRIQNGDPMAHAEIDCLTKAGPQSTYRDTTLYSTLMPCYLCSGAAVQFGIPRIVVGESVNFHGALDFLHQHAVEVIDLHDAECIRLMSQFIKAHPALWNEQVGR